MQWNDNEIKELPRWMEKHVRRGTSWKRRVALWKREFGTSRSMGSLRGQYNRLQLGWVPQRKLERAYREESPASSRIRSPSLPNNPPQRKESPRPNHALRKPRRSIWSPPSSPESFPDQEIRATSPPELQVPREKLVSPPKDNEPDTVDSIATAETLPRDEAWELREALARTIHGALDECMCSFPRS
jgi:hypothetical protein